MGVKQANYIPTLDGWRAIAICGVILSHSFPSDYWTRHGALGVNLFFAISGYLITARLLDEHAQTGFVSIRNFYVRRAFRILPPAVLYLAVIAGLTMAGILYSSWTDVASCLLFTRNYWGANAQNGWYTGHFWSLAVEEQFYLFWPVLLVLSGIRRARWIAPALAVAFSVWRALDVRHGWIATLLHNEALRNHGLRSDYRMDALLWGCTLALLTSRVDFARWIPKRAAAPVALSALFAAIAFDVFQPKSYMIAESLLFPVVLSASTAQPANWLGRALESKPFGWLGQRSYSLYLWQQLFVSQYHHAPLQHFPVNVALALACACFSYRFVEGPMIRLGRHFAGPPRLAQSPPRTIAAAA